MKPTFLYTLLTIMVTNIGIGTVDAQSYYPMDVVKTFRINDDVTYVSDGKALSGRLYNSENVLHNVRQRCKDGNPIPADIFYRRTPPLRETENNFYVFNDIINEVFTAEEKRKAAGDSMRVAIYFDSDTGNLMEVLFSFRFTDRGFSAISPTSYYRLEQEIRKRIKVEITEAGRQLNYNMRWIPYEGSFFEHELLPDIPR